MINCDGYLTAVKPVLSDHKTIHIFGFQTGGCLLLHESSAKSFLQYFHSAIAMSMLPDKMVALNRITGTWKNIF